MANAEGTEVKVAAKKSSTWGTAVQCAAGDGVLVHPFNLKRDQARLVDESLGQPGAKVSDLGSAKAGGNLPMDLRYDGLDLLIALFMGQTGGAPVQQGMTAAYAQKFKLAPSIEGLMATLAAWNGVNVDEYPSIKPSRLTIKGSAFGVISAALDVLAYDRVVDSAVNTSGTFASVTIDETKNRVLFSQGVFRMNARDGSALAGGDVIAPSAFELVLERPQDESYAAGGGNRMVEPLSSGLIKGSLKLDFPRYSSKQNFLDWASDAAKKVDITFTGASIEAPYNREFKISLPNLAIKSADLPYERGAFKHSVEFDALYTDTAPSGMTGILEPAQIDVINKQSTDVLA